MVKRGGLAYPWLEPSTVNTEGKYRLGANGEIRLNLTVGPKERTLLTRERHPDLVGMIASVKRGHGEPPSGVFYINEWRHVLVKAGGATWYAGEYSSILEFDLDGEMISARAPSALSPGDTWKGPRVGIRYTLAASGDDVYCKRLIGNRTERKEYLSDYIDGAASFVRTFSKFRPQGGRLYINEARELFSPDPDRGFVYLGFAPTDRWFPEPRPE
jgi:hypothetical protein